MSLSNLGVLCTIELILVFFLKKKKMKQKGLRSSAIQLRAYLISARPCSGFCPGKTADLESYPISLGQRTLKTFEYLSKIQS